MDEIVRPPRILWLCFDERCVLMSRLGFIAGKIPQLRIMSTTNRIKPPHTHTLEGIGFQTLL